MMVDVKKLFKSFRFAFQGIHHAIRYENNLKVHAIATAVVMAAGWFARLSSMEWCLIFLAIGLVVITELVNTALERLVDLVSPHHDPRAGLIKDIAAGAVLVASVVALAVGVVVFGGKV